MKNLKLIFIGLLVSSACILSGQNTSDSIQVQKKMSTIFMQEGKRLTPKQLLQITKVNTEAYELMKLAKSNYNAGAVFGFAGGALIGWPLGTALGGGDPNWVLAGIGAGFVLISIPFSVAYTKHATKAVSIYNNGIANTESRKVDFNVGLTSVGVGLTMTF